MMLLKHWLMALHHGLRFESPRSFRRNTHSHSRRGFTRSTPAQTELLEDRTLLTPFIVSTLEDVVAEDGFVSLREAILSANSNTAVNADIALAGEEDGDIITFDPSLAGGTITLNAALGQLEITDDLVIDGGNPGDITISGNNLVRIFSINTSGGVGTETDVSLLNLDLEFGNTAGSTGDDGGAILITNGEDVTIDSLTITNSIAAGNGGAIFAGNGTLTIINSQIGNEVLDNDVWSNTGALTTDKIFAFVDTQNSTTGTSATLEVLNNSGTSLLSPFDPVAAGVDVDEAGSVFYDVESFLDEITPYEIYTSIVDGTAESETEGNGTSATANTISEDTLISGTLDTVDDEDFFQITLGSSDSRLVVIIDNDPEDDTTVTGTLVEILDTNGSTVLASGLFSGGEADASIASGLTGGATYFIRISSTGGTGTYEFVAKAVGSGDQVQEEEVNNSPSVAEVLTDSQFGQGNIEFGGGNRALNGGGIFVSGGTLNLDFTAVNNNAATGASADQGGGGIYSLGGTVTIENTSLVNFNTASGANGSGGGILVNGGTLTITDSILSGNTAMRAGGGLETRSSVSAVTATMTDTDFSDNVTGSNPGNGGGVHVTSPSGANATTITITGGSFTGNSAAAEGGGLWNDVTGTMTINGVNIDGNTASGAGSDQGGGGVFNNGGTLIIQSSMSAPTVISNNIANGAAGSGGGILNDGGTLTMTGAVITGNSAVRAGGGIEATTVNSRNSIATLTGVTISGNTVGSSPGNGGGVHITDAVGGNTSTFTLTGGSVTGNSAAAEGGGLWNDAGGAMTINGVAITNNVASGASADQGGGGVFNNGGTVVIQNNASTATLIAGNIADGAAGSGGGILNDGGRLTITGATISNNTALRAGGGIEATTANSRDSIATLTNVTIVNNTAGANPGNGGGVHISDAAMGNSSTFTMIGGSVTGNFATAEGGGLWNDVGGTMTLRGVSITANTASGAAADQGGGGVFNNGGTVNIRSNAAVATTISNNVANGALGSGGGILNDGGTLNIQGALIDSNSAVRAGGGIEVTTANGRDSDVTLTVVTISNNVVGSSPGNGGGVHITDAAGGNQSEFTVIGGQIIGNSAAAEGGGLWNDAGGVMVISGTRISGNTASGAAADQGGGGIFNNGGTVEIGNFFSLGLGTTVISNNVANGAAGSGGGILNDGGTLEISGAFIDSNTAVRAGGGIEATTANGRDSNIAITNSTISFNVVGSGPGNGGGVHISDAAGGNASTFDISNSDVIGNSAAAEGGGLWNAEGGTMTIDGVLILNNIASGSSSDQGGGGIFNEGGTVHITNTAGATQIIANFANGSVGSGGGILNDGGTLTITGAVINSNAAVRAGGGIEATTANGRDSIVTITGTEISLNEVGNSPGNGGGVHISDAVGGSTSTFTMTGGSVSGNSAAAEGGGLWNDVGGTMTINGVSITGNTASGNSADQGGGGVFNNSGTVIIQNNMTTATSISNNIADGAAGSGGGILNDGGTLTITGAVISGNSAVRAGGGIEATTANGRNSLATLTNVTISNNLVGSSPGNGGGVHITDAVGGNTSSFTLTGGSVTSNSAAAEGGGLWNAVGGVMTINGTTISGNTASGSTGDNGGGGIFNDGGLLSITLATLNNNVANGTAGNGGGIFNETGGSVQVSQTTLNGNIATGTATTGGGGIFNRGTLDLQNSTVSANSASNQGGGIWNSGTLDATQITVSGNTGASSGGGVFAATSGTVDIINSTITGNRATAGSGGGMANGGGSVFLESTIVAGNVQGTTTPSDISGAVLSGSQFNLIGVDTGLSGITDGTNNNLIGTGTPINPLLGPLANNGGPTFTHALLPGSLAINAGSNPEDLDFDQRGTSFPRTIGPQTDIGAVEAQVNLIAVGSGRGDSRVRIYDSSTGELLATINPYGAGFMGEIRTAVADVNGDGNLDVITGAGPGGGPHVKVFSGADNFMTELFSFFAFDPSFMGGVHVAAANFNPADDNNADIVVAADTGGGPHVIVFNGTDLSVRQSFFAYSAAFAGGVRVATGDISGDGIPDIITAPGPGGGPHIRVFDGSSSQFTTTPLDIGQTMMNPAGSFFAYSPGFTAGVFVASGDIDGDGRDDIITGPGAGGGPHVRVFSGMDGEELLSFFAFDPGFLGGITVGSSQGPDGNGIDDIIVGAGPGGGPVVRIFSQDSVPNSIFDFFAFEADFTGGVFVSGGTTTANLALPLLFSGGLIAGEALPLSQGELDVLVGAALIRLEEAGASSADIAALSSVDVRVSDLSPGVLGLSLPGTILIDVDASGAGWFIDPTPLDDFEFDAHYNAVAPGAVGRIDLLTVLLHELGHQLGAEDLGILAHPENLMADSLTTGKRRLPNEDLDAFFSDEESLDTILS